MAQAALAFARAAGPFLLVALVVGVGAQLAQIGFLFTAKPLAPKLERINPVAGFQRIFSRRSLFELAKALFKVAVVGAVAYWVLSGTILQLVGLIHATPVIALQQVGGALGRLLWTTAGAWLVIAAFDYAFQRNQYLTRLRMTPYEFKQEQRETEGDPHVRQRIRQEQRRIAGRRMIQAVRTADVVITNPTHVAVALKYEMDRMNAPVVVAKGADYLARRIIEEARAHGVRVVENPPWPGRCTRRAMWTRRSPNGSTGPWPRSWPWSGASSTGGDGASLRTGPEAGSPAAPEAGRRPAPCGRGKRGNGSGCADSGDLPSAPSPKRRGGDPGDSPHRGDDGHPHASRAFGRALGVQHQPQPDDPPGHHERQERFGVLGLPQPALGDHPLPPGAQHLLDPPHPAPRRTRVR